MKSFKLLINLVAIAVLCAAHNDAIVDEADAIRIHFGEEMASTIRSSGLEALQTAIENMDKVYDAILAAKLGLGSATISEINSYRENLKKIIEELPTMNSSELFEAIASLIIDSEKIGNYLDDIEDEASLAILKDILKNGDDDVEKLKQEFLQTVVQKWRELYAAIPADELTQHKEYNEINAMLPNIEHGLESNGAKVMEFFQSLIRFFDYEDWKFFLDIDRSDEEPISD